MEILDHRLEHAALDNALTAALFAVILIIISITSDYYSIVAGVSQLWYRCLWYR